MFGLGILALIGVVLAVVERRRGKSFLAHDLNQSSGAQTEADREAMRSTDALKGRMAVSDVPPM